ncbi:acyltransferase [Bacteroidia bacterium]|nr:acyltransferase [Bacteroidia bacterium]
MDKRIEFDDIRPYSDEEAVSVIEKLIQDPQFKRVMSFVFPDKDWEKVVGLLRSFKNRHDFQHGMVKGTVLDIVGKTASSIDCTGFENLQKGRAYTYISNHRDIVLDASLLSSILAFNGYETVEIAIGDNLLLHPWIEHLVRLNKSFIVKRGVSVRQMLEVSNHLSQYIHYAVTGKNESVWIAQREGRAKDSNDRTQESLLKMLAMGGGQDFLSNLKELNITPVAFSYEYDPCDYLKAREFQQKRDNPEFKKSQADDLLNMQTGISGFKGHIHFQFGQPIHPLLEDLDTSLPKNELVSTVASLIDKGIFLNYRFYPGNYIAYDRLWGNNRCIKHYTERDVQTFDAYLNKQLGKIVLENKDLPFLAEKILEMYAYPVKNQLEL